MLPAVALASIAVVLLPTVALLLRVALLLTVALLLSVAGVGLTGVGRLAVGGVGVDAGSGGVGDACAGQQDEAKGRTRPSRSLRRSQLIRSFAMSTHTIQNFSRWPA